MMYVQCEMQKGKQVDVSWIEEKYATIGKKIKRKDENEQQWDNGWVVTKIFGKTTEDHAKGMRDLYKHHRKGTDI